jgi:NAD(P)-dependent dehydrogenase (short-subunit alcohol dehydrogenase family)
LGTVVSQKFFEAGAKLVLVGSRPEPVQALAEAMGADRAFAVAANLAEAAEADRVVAETVARFGRVDILLNLAGGFAGGAPVVDSRADDLTHMLAINLHTTYNLSRAAARVMMAQNWGRIVNTGSRDALKGRANFSAYAISKAAVLRLTESMAAELQAYHITVNAILPGTIDTAANRRSTPNADVSTWVKPAVIAEALLFLTQAETAINGAAIPLYEQS